MRRKALVFFPQNLYPPRSGFHKRGLQMLAGLRDIGFDITLASSRLSAYPRWEAASVQNLEQSLVKTLRIYEDTGSDRLYISCLRGVYRGTGISPPVNTSLNTPPGMRRWFRRIVHEVSPDIVLMNYALWDGLIDHKGSFPRRIIDSIDLRTLNQQMWDALVRCLPASPIRADEVSDEVVSEDFYEKLKLKAKPEEFRIFVKYHNTITLSLRESMMVREKTRNTAVAFIPMTYEAVSIQNLYSGSALFPTGPNPYNVQGYLYFVKKVLPQVKQFTSEFSLQVTGHVCGQVAPADNVVLSGFVPDLASAYAVSPFVICPVFGGTGQQIKIVEAMAHGVPVIALTASASGSPIRHGENGLVANDAREFAECVVQLWRDRELCRRLGSAARETIAAEFATSHLVEKLSAMVN